MSSLIRTAVTAAVSSLLTLSLAAGCEVTRPFTGLGPAPTAPPAATNPAPTPGQPTSPPAQGAPTSPLAQAQAAPTGQPNDAVIRVYRDASPSVVNIISTVVTRDFFNQAMPRSAGSGSGIIIDDQGNIATNNHVVEDADRLEVSLPDGSTVPAKLVGRDPRSDLAVVRVDVPKDRLKVAKLGDASQVEVGEMAIAIGNPFGLERTVTAGVVSGRRSVVEEPGGPSLTSQQPADSGLLINAIQTDASINPGNSGGPLFNARGEVIGINTLILSPGAQGGQGGNIGIGFAIPVDFAKRVVPELIAKGKYAHPFLGVSTQEITETIAKDNNLPVGAGLLVAQVDQGTPAARAGLRGGSRPQDARSRRVSLGGDIITAIDGQPLKRPEELLVYLEMQKSPGDTVTLSLIRDGQNLQVPVQIGERPSR
jgi:S1-C subfamily serine protease